MIGIACVVGRVTVDVTPVIGLESCPSVWLAVGGQGYKHDIPPGGKRVEGVQIPHGGAQAY